MPPHRSGLLNQNRPSKTTCANAPTTPPTSTRRRCRSFTTCKGRVRSSSISHVRCRAVNGPASGGRPSLGRGSRRAVGRVRPHPRFPCRARAPLPGPPEHRRLRPTCAPCCPSPDRPAVTAVSRRTVSTSVNKAASTRPSAMSAAPRVAARSRTRSSGGCVPPVPATPGQCPTPAVDVGTTVQARSPTACGRGPHVASGSPVAGHSWRRSLELIGPG